MFHTQYGDFNYHLRIDDYRQRMAFDICLLCGVDISIVVGVVVKLLSLVTSLILLKPGVLASASEGVLERVQETRVEYGYGLEYQAPPDMVLIGVEDCGLLGYSGLAIIENVGAMDVYVVDCEQAKHRGQLRQRDLVADVNDPELNHERATLILWRE